jgi:hypothetical protein
MRTVRSGTRRGGASGRPTGRGGGGEAGAVAKVLADEPNRDGAFADRCRRTLHRAAADIARGEHSRRAGLQQVGIVVAAGPRRSVACVRAKRWPSEEVAAVVEQDGSAEPPGVRLGADQDDQGRGRQNSRVLVVTSSTSTRSSQREPSRPRTSVWYRTPISGWSAMRSIRYCDMVSARPVPRTAIVTGCPRPASQIAA